MKEMNDELTWVMLGRTALTLSLRKHSRSRADSALAWSVKTLLWWRRAEPPR